MQLSAAQLTAESLLCVISARPAEAAAVRDSQAAAAAAAEASSRRRTLTSDVASGSPPALLLGRLAALAFVPHGATKALDVTLQVPPRTGGMECQCGLCICVCVLGGGGGGWGVCSARLARRLRSNFCPNVRSNMCHAPVLFGDG